MELSSKIMEALINFPKSSVLFWVGILNLGFLLYFFIVKKGFQKNIYRAYFIYALFTIIWVITNAYFQSEFLVSSGPATAKFMALVANIGASCSIIGFYYISCAIKDRGIPLYSWVLMTFLWIMAFLLNSIPNLIVQDVKILESGSFQIIQGPGTGIFFLTGVVVIILSVANFIFALKKDNGPLKNMRIFYILFAMSLMYGSTIFFLIILPFYFQNYNYAWVPPLISLLEVLMVGYAIMAKRFFSLWKLLLHFFKMGLNLFGAYLLTLWTFKNLFKTASDGPRILCFLIFFYGLYKILNSRTFFTYFGGTEAENIHYLASDFEKTEENMDFKGLEKELQNQFKQRGIKMTPKLKQVNSDFKKKYPALLEYFSTHKKPLIAEEIRLEDKKLIKINQLLTEMESLGGACFSLLDAKNHLIAILAFSHKKHAHLYKKDELKALTHLEACLKKFYFKKAA